MSRRIRISRREIVSFLLGFAALQIVLFFTLEHVRPDWRDPEYGFKLDALQQRQAAVPGEPLLLVLGSSRVLNAVQAHRFEPPPLVYNFGLTHHGPLQQLLVLNRLLDDGVRPDAVIIEVAPHMLAVEGEGREVVPIERQRWKDLTRLRDYDDRNGTLTLDWAEARFVPVYTNRYVMLSGWLPNWVPWDSRVDFVQTQTLPDGWLPMPKPLNPATEAETWTLMLEQDGGQVRQLKLSERATRCITASLERCQAEGIAATVVLMPEPTAFRTLYSVASEATLQRFLGTLGVPVIDGRTWVEDGGFRDPHHVNPEGATQFTTRFIVEVQRWRESR